MVLFATLCTAYFFINKPRTKEKRIQPLKKIFYMALAGTFLVFLVALAISLFNNTSNNKETRSRLMGEDSLFVMKEDSSKFDETSNADTATINSKETLNYSYLNEEQIRYEISESLREENVDRAIMLLNYLRSEEAKDEEREHIFNYCMKQGELEKAKQLAELFESTSKRNEAKQQIALEMLKTKK